MHERVRLGCWERAPFGPKYTEGRKLSQRQFSEMRRPHNSREICQAA